MVLTTITFSHKEGEGDGEGGRHSRKADQGPVGFSAAEMTVGREFDLAQEETSGFIDQGGGLIASHLVEGVFLVAMKMKGNHDGGCSSRNPDPLDLDADNPVV